VSSAVGRPWSLRRWPIQVGDNEEAFAPLRDAEVASAEYIPGDTDGVDRCPRPVELTGVAQPVQQPMVQTLPDAGLLSVP
jgi:hypothetical protein